MRGKPLPTSPRPTRRRPAAFVENLVFEDFHIEHTVKGSGLLHRRAEGQSIKLPAADAEPSS
jgi:hypothetical protein